MFQQRGVQPWTEELAQNPARSPYIDSNILSSKLKIFEQLTVFDRRYGKIRLA